MAVKVAPAPGSVIEETKRTRVIPPNSPDNEAEKPWRVLDKWDYIGSLAPEQWARENLVVYLYRYDDKGNPWGIGKFTGALDEFKVLEMFGGGRFNLKMKRGPQLIINDDFQLEGPAKTPGVNGTPALNTPGAPNENVLLTALNALIEELRAARGGTVAQDAIKNAMSLQGQVFGAGVEAVKSTLTAGAPAAPAGNSLKETLEILTVAKTLLTPAGPATNSVKDTLDMIAALKGAGLFGTGDGKAGIALELVRQVPQVATTLVQGIQAWQMAEEARARQAAIMRGGGNPIPVTPNPSQPTPAPKSNVIPISDPAGSEDAIPPAAPQADAIAASNMQVQPMPIETLEQMLCNIIADPGLTVEEAANEACTLIERASPGQIDLMLRQGEEWLLNLFKVRPVLQQVANHPRLSEFVKKFIEVGKAAPTMQPPNPNAPVA